MRGVRGAARCAATVPLKRNIVSKGRGSCELIGDPACGSGTSRGSTRRAPRLLTQSHPAGTCQAPSEAQLLAAEELEPPHAPASGPSTPRARDQCGWGPGCWQGAGAAPLIENQARAARPAGPPLYAAPGTRAAARRVGRTFRGAPGVALEVSRALCGSYHELRLVSRPKAARRS